MTRRNGTGAAVWKTRARREDEKEREREPEGEKAEGFVFRGVDRGAERRRKDDRGMFGWWWCWENATVEVAVAERGGDRTGQCDGTVRER